MNPGLFCIAATLGLSAVALGAFGAHGLRGLVEPERLAVWRTAVDYQMFHTLVLLGLSTAPAVAGGAAGRFARRSFILGMVLFSGSLYLLVLSGRSWLGVVTPFGGLCLMAGWAALALHGWRAWRGSRR